MPNNYLIINATIINEFQEYKADVFIEKGIISKIIRGEKESDQLAKEKNILVIDAEGKHLFPGIIDTHVHFREPGLTHKGDIYSESRAAVAGGITTYMEMPNTIPNVLTQEQLEDKYKIATEKSLANFSFFLGASNNNLNEII